MIEIIYGSVSSNADVRARCGALQIQKELGLCQAPPSAEAAVGLGGWYNGALETMAQYVEKCYRLSLLRLCHAIKAIAPRNPLDSYLALLLTCLGIDDVIHQVRLSIPNQLLQPGAYTHIHTHTHTYTHIHTLNTCLPSFAREGT